MAILNSTNIEGKVVSLLVNSNPGNGLATEQVGSATVQYDGIAGDCHAGLTRPSCTRVRRLYPVGTEIRNVRQITIVSVQDLAKIAAKMGVPHLKPEWLGANILLSGIPDFTLVPPSSRLIFSSGASLVVDMENEPCKYPGDIIEEHCPGFGKLFAYCARGLRGITAWVENQGDINIGDSIALHIPPQRIYDIAVGNAQDKH